MTQYYELFFEVKIKGAWYLSDIVDENGKEVLGSHFNQGKHFNQPTKLTVIQNVVGNPVDYRWTAFAVPIVSSAFADGAESFDPGAIQRIPVTVAPRTTGYEILNILTMLDCIDREHTNIEYYTEKNHAPEVVGQIKSMRNITIKSDIPDGHHIFRLTERWTIIVVSEVLKRALEARKFTGMKFTPINTT